MNDTLTTIAEVSVAIVGFVAIVSALNKNQIQGGIERVLLINVLAEPIAVVMFALLPLIAGSYLANAETTLRVLLALFAFVHLFLSYWVYIRFAPFFDSTFPRTSPTLICLAAVLLCLTQLFVSAGFGLEYLEFIYLIGLYWLLGMCFLNFLLLFLRNPEGDV